MKKYVALLLLPVLAASAHAQGALEEDEHLEVRRYTVEMIIFSYAQNVSAGSEIFPPDVPVIVDSPLDEGLEGVNASKPNPEIVTRADTFRKYELVMLAEKDFRLVETYEHLDRLGAYEPLMHFGWTQPTYPDEEVEARPLSSFATPPDGLEGELTLYLSRYLHLTVKLQLDQPVKDEPASYPVRYRIEEDRIFRNGELRYFDHPKFGVLAKITRVEEEQSNPDELADDMEMLGD